MSKIATEGISTIWMSTGADSLKTIDFRKNPKAGLCFQDKGDSVALTGTVEVVTDEKMKRNFGRTGLSSISPVALPTRAMYC